MKKRNEAVILAVEAEDIEAIRDFFSEWYTIEQLYETLAKSCTCIIHLSNKGMLNSEDKENLARLVNQHELMIEHMKPFARKED